MGARILVVDDEKLIRWSMTQALEQAGYVVEEAETAGQALGACERELPDLVLLDFRLPDQNGNFVLQKLRETAPKLPVIMITAHASVPGAVEAIRDGACDYISKPFEISDLLNAVGTALEYSRLREVSAWQRGQVLKASGGGEIVAHSVAMRSIEQLINRIASSGASTVLLTGESGVGKGLIARALHERSSARDEPFMNIACTSLPDQLLESELFGHEKGSFTDAKSRKKGLIELADRGTAFLDEIGDISPSLQAKLLGFLEDRTFRRIGGVRDISVSLRVVAATNKNLEEEVAAGRFRQDLLYRLKVIPCHVPPLRDRAEDLEQLGAMFVMHFNAEFGRSVQGFDPDALAAMRLYPWPGNVRELRNAIERAVLLGDGEFVRRIDLPPEILDGEALTPGTCEGGPFELPGAGLNLEALERDLVCQALHRARGNRARAARLLGMNRDQMRYRIKKFDLVEYQSEEA